MATEVLRNMLYAGSEALQRPFVRRHGRGALPGRPDARCGVGEVILHLPKSAAGQPLGDGEQRRGVRRLDQRPCAATPPWWSTSTGPMPLWRHMLVGKRLFDLFDYSAKAGKTGQYTIDRNCCGHIAHRREADRLADWQPRGRGRRPGGGLNRPPSRRTSSPRWTARDCCRPSPSSSRAGCDACRQTVPTQPAAADDQGGPRPHPLR